MNHWREYSLRDAIELNPKRELKKGTLAKFVKMEHLQPFNRSVDDFEIKEYSGGAKFKNEDTIMARITPCLENGKTGYVKFLVNSEVAGGSTEFIVLTGKEGVTIPSFVYYLAISDDIRDKAIKSMTGTSGRQRVDNDLFGSIKVKIPTIPEQETIAKILSDFDNKIELNNKMNRTLEQMTQAIFKHWFIDFEFPNENGKPYKSSGGKMVYSEMGKIPEGWKISVFNDLINCTIGGDWGKEKEEGNYINRVKVIRGTDIPAIASGNKGRMPERYILDRIFKERGLKADDLVVEISGGSPDQSTGRITYISKEFLDRFRGNIICSNFCRAIRPKTSEDSNYLYNLWKSLYNSDIFFNFENGTTGIKNLNINALLHDYKIVIPTF